MTQRFWIGLVTALTLAVQAVAPAWSMAVPAEASAPVVQEQAVPPCHEPAAPAADTAAVATMDCCDGDDCACAAMCGGAALPAAATLARISPPRAQAVSLMTPSVLAAHSAFPLRPPIASQR